MEGQTDIKSSTLIDAIHAVQQEVGVIEKTRTAKIGDKFSYKYADLTDIWVAIKPILEKYKLTIVQYPTSASSNIGIYYKTEIYASNGESISAVMPLQTTKEDPQALGSAITYIRRYMLVSMLGLFTDDDPDALDHKLATGEQKRAWLTAYNAVARKANPDGKAPTYGEFIKFIREIFGKDFDTIRADEADSVLETIKAFEG